MDIPVPNAFSSLFSPPVFFLFSLNVDPTPPCIPSPRPTVPTPTPSPAKRRGPTIDKRLHLYVHRNPLTLTKKQAPTDRRPPPPPFRFGSLSVHCFSFRSGTHPPFFSPVGISWPPKVVPLGSRFSLMIALDPDCTLPLVPASLFFFTYLFFL